MRIGITTWTARLAGGVETYLGAVMPALAARGHELALLHEVDAPRDRGRIAPEGTPQWCIETVGETAVAALRAWKPDVIFAHGLEDPVFEERVARLAPAVLFAHAYRGTCISGTKSHAWPVPVSCSRQLGWPCLVQYFPRRCGGVSPVTMTRLYRRESRRRDGLGQYAALVCFSEHIRTEYIRHGAAPDRSYVLPCHIPAGRPGRTAHRPDAAARVVFIGRMEALKGGHLLLAALPLVEQALGRPVHVWFVGDGRLRQEWEARARRICRLDTSARVEFTGWIGAEERDRLLRESDLLVVPSIWPEPYGLIGLEAAAYGVPAVAFDVGGIRQWLHDNVNGFLVPANPPRATALAAAMIRSLENREVHARLSQGALKVSVTHSLQSHVAALEDVLAAAASMSPAVVC